MPTPTQASPGSHHQGNSRRPPAILCSLVLLALVANLTILWPRPAAAGGPTAYGVAVTPQNFPDFTIDDVDAAFALSKQIGDYAVFIYQTYPAFFHDTPADLVPDYFTWLAHHVLPTDEILLMEVGWPTEARGTEREQRQFIQALPGLLNGVIGRPHRLGVR